WIDEDAAGAHGRNRGGGRSAVRLRASGRSAVFRTVRVDSGTGALHSEDGPPLETPAADVPDVRHVAGVERCPGQPAVVGRVPASQLTVGPALRVGCPWIRTQRPCEAAVQ